MTGRNLPQATLFERQWSGGYAIWGMVCETASAFAADRTGVPAAQWALMGLAEGTAKHKFIEKNLENMGRCHEELNRLVGEQVAAQLVEEALKDHQDSVVKLGGLGAVGMIS